MNQTACTACCPCPRLRLSDLRLEPSGDGQYLLICCRERILAMFSGMGGDVEEFDLVDVGRVSAEAVMERLAQE